MARTTPMCSSQYPFLFNACRIPRKTRDELKSFPGGKHIVVARSNKFYTFDVYRPDGTPFSPAEIEV